MMTSMHGGLLFRTFLIVALLVVSAASCGTSEPGLRTSVFADGFVGPTQMVFAPDGDLIVAELNGGENDEQGRVIRVSADDPTERTVLQTGLDKPTGVAVTGDRLWIMDRRQLLHTSLEPNADLVPFTDELPFNGRSQGTLTVTNDDRLFFDTSGSKRGSARVHGSGTLFVIEDASGTPSEPAPFATGFKHAYAHLVDETGTVWVVEMTDGTFDESRASDELLAVSQGDDAGWPFCVENNRAVVEFGGTSEVCDGTPPSHALLGAGATPTSFVITPWDPDSFLIALWLRGLVVQVPRTTPAADRPHVPITLIDTLESPQHLLVFGDGVLMSDHDSGEIFFVEMGG